MRFDELTDDHRLLRTLEAMGFTEARPIQALALPAGLAGRDVVALAPTGTGKTIAFGLPLAQRLLRNPPAASGKRRVDPRTRLRALVVCPTRELAAQVEEELARLVKGLVLRTLVVTGKSAITPQKEALSKGVDILVGTPGRLRELLEADAMTLAFVEQVVVDEADRMLDLGFLPQVRWLLERTAANPQRMLFTATLPKEVEKLVDEFLTDPERVEVGVRNAAAPHLTHRLFRVPEASKVPMLLSLLGGSPAGVLVFARTRRRVGWVGEALRRNGLKVGMLHGDRTPRQRTAALEGFSAGRLGVLVATDVAARGLHVPGIRLVVNYDLPLAPEEWVHRVGRGAHGGGVGGSISFRGEDEADRWRAITKLAGLAIDAEPTPSELLAPATPRRERRTDPSKPAARKAERSSGRPPSKTTAKKTTRGGERASGERAGGSGGSGGAGGKRVISGRGPRIGRKSAARKPPPRGSSRRGAANVNSLRPGRGVRRAGGESPEAT
ncbi:MAG: DEAD/DEAH box helicase [Phycisphaerales bacterium]